MKSLDSYVKDFPMSESLKPMTMPSDIDSTFLKFVDFLKEIDWQDEYIDSALENNAFFKFAGITKKSKSILVKIIGTIYYLGIQPKDWLDVCNWKDYSVYDNLLNDYRKKWHEKLKQI